MAEPGSQFPLGPEPFTMACPSCGETIVTTVKMRPTMMTHLIALLLFCLCICLIVIPYLIDICKSAHHYCPNCGAFLGVFNRQSDN